MILFGICVIVLSYIGIYMAGVKRDLVFLVASFMLVIVSIILYVFHFSLYVKHYDDDCTKYGGRYVLDEKIRNENGPAFELYKCVRE